MTPWKQIDLRGKKFTFPQGRGGIHKKNEYVENGYVNYATVYNSELHRRRKEGTWLD